MGEGEYVLEVSSPGADRPLTERRHFVRATGRLVKLQLKEGGDLVARLLTVDDEGLDLEVPGVKGRKPTARRVAFDDIVKARVEIEFNRKDKKEEEA
jgi:ribosome maturation factor RimP